MPLRALAHERCVAPLLFVEVTGLGAGSSAVRSAATSAIEDALRAAAGTLLRRDDVVVCGPNARWYAALLLDRAVAASARAAVSDADLGIVAARLRASIRSALESAMPSEARRAGVVNPAVRVGWTIIEPRDAERPLTELRHALRGAAVVGRIEERRGTVLAAITHELRTPLTSIVGFVERLREDGDASPKRRSRALSIVAEEARRLSRLVDGLIDVGAWQAGSLTLRRRAADLGQIARRAKALAAEAARERRVRVTVSGEATADVDPDRVLQVLVNLIDNAIRHAKARGLVDVVISGGRKGASIVVSDDGEGFDSETIGRIGVPFATGSNGKVGLGLAIASMLVAAHGGMIEFGGSRSRGARVTIQLPR
ncbi:MAG TPA: ATP-binding protein [Candidatus Eremiobacteraceae bacterium]|nr:ATP-binding protein [Candidatus Eremiobacteraceae bacterium]